LDRPKHGEDSKEEEIVEVGVVEEEAAAGSAGVFVYSAFILRFGYTGGGGQSLVARMMRSVIESGNLNDVEVARARAGGYGR
jgi:hypothetical protein